MDVTYRIYGTANLLRQTLNVMHLTWWIIQFGRQVTLDSGRAVLTRQQTL